MSLSLSKNAASIAANTFANSALGFLFWIIAARLYFPAEVGLGAAYLSALTLLAALGEMGLGTTLIRFASTLGDRSAQFINSSLLFVAISTVALALIFVVGVNFWIPELNELTHSPLNWGIFVVTCLLFSLAQFLDKLYVAFRAASYMLIRNLLANVLRLGLLLLVGRNWGAVGFLVATGGGALFTFSLSAGLWASRIVPDYRWRFEFNWSVLHDKVNYTLGNHFSQLLLSLPPLVYPLLVTTLLGAQANAYFYTSWMIANLLFTLPLSVATSAFVHSSEATIPKKEIFRKATGLTILGLVPIALAMIVFSSQILAFFGKNYAEQAHALLLWLVLSIFPYTLNIFAITYLRTQSNVYSLVILSGAVALTSTLMVLGFGSAYSLAGIGLGWLVGQVTACFIILLVFWLSRDVASSSKTLFVRHD